MFKWSARGRLGARSSQGVGRGKAWTEFFKYVKMATNMPVPYVLVNETDIPQFLA